MTKPPALSPGGEMDCTCAKCIKCCSEGNPGWFAPGEAEHAATLLGMAFEEFREKYLITDYRDSDAALGEGVCAYVYAPRKIDNKTGTIIEGDRKVASWGYPFDRGRCVFLDEHNRCRIHAAKPTECRLTFGCDDKRGKENGSGHRSEIARLWLKAGNPLANNL